MKTLPIRINAEHHKALKAIADNIQPRIGVQPLVEAALDDYFEKVIKTGLIITYCPADKRKDRVENLIKSIQKTKH